MKAFRIFLHLIPILLLFTYCKKEDSEQYQVIEINDTLKAVDYSYNGYHVYYLIKNDTQTYISMDISSVTGGNTKISYKHITVKPNTGIELFTDSSFYTLKRCVSLLPPFDSVVPALIPKKFDIGDTINTSDQTDPDSLFLTYSYFPGYVYVSGGYYTPPGSLCRNLDTWINATDKYFAFCDRSKRIMGYVQVSVLDYRWIIVKRLTISSRTSRIIVK